MYCTIEDILRTVPEREIIELTDDSQSETYDTLLLNSVIQEQSDYIDSYLRGRYPLPITSNAILKDICVILVVFKLTQRRMLYKMPQSIIDLKAKCEEKLIKIQKGDIIISDVAESSRTPHISYTTKEKVFTEDLLAQYI